MNDKPINASSFFQYAAEEKLMAVKCEGCGTLWCPPRSICPDCNSFDLEWVELSGKGKISTFSVIPYGPVPLLLEGYGRDNPYCAGIIELDEGVTISGQIMGVDLEHPENIEIGTPVTVDFIERASWHFIEDVYKNKKVYPVFKVN